MSPDVAPDLVLTPDAVRSGLNTRYVGRHVTCFGVVNSTNDWMKQEAERGAEEGSLAIADRQTAGRGRLNRRWEAPAGSSLLVSLLFRPTFIGPDKAQLITIICSLAAADAVQMTTGVAAGLKWPNDLLLDGRKLAGILTELGFEPDTAGVDRLLWCVVGIGLNVNVDFSTQPELADVAISLAMALGRPVPRLPLLQRMLEGVERRYEELRAGHSPHCEWAERLVTLGQPVSVTGSGGTRTGVAEGVDETGALLLRETSGTLTRVLAGDVTLRPPGKCG